jgi:hypothetical protein
MKKQIKIAVALSFIISFTCFHLGAQTNWKKYLVLGSSQFASGFLDGTIESISFHYDNGFKPRFKHVNDQFWNPQKSWVNKYKNGDCEAGPKFTGSTTCFAWTTDAYHLLRTTKRTIDGFTLTYYANDGIKSHKTRKQKFKAAAKDFIILTAIRCIGFHVSYSLLFKSQPVRN